MTGRPGPAGGDAPRQGELPDLLAETGRRHPLLLRLVYLAAGLVCMLLALVGSFLPLIPGFVFAILGLGLLSMASARVRRAVNRAERRLPLRVRLWLRPGYQRTTPPAGHSPGSS